MQFGYFFTDFHSRMKDSGIYTLKSLSFILIDEEYGAMIFDTGSPQDTATLVSSLKKYFNLTPDDIKWVFNTHIHPDHFGGNSLFRKAKIIFSKRDFDFSAQMADVAFSNKDMLKFLLDNCPGYRNSYGEFEANATKSYILDYWSKDNIGFKYTHAFIEEDPDIPPFITPIFTPGHTFFHYSFELALNGASFGNKAFVSGDAISNRFILKEDNDLRMNEPHMDFDKYFASLELFRDNKDLIIPGHDRPFYPETCISIRKNNF